MNFLTDCKLVRIPIVCVMIDEHSMKVLAVNAVNLGQIFEHNIDEALLGGCIVSLYKSSKTECILQPGVAMGRMMSGRDNKRKALPDLTRRVASVVLPIP